MLQSELEICAKVCSGDHSAFEQFFRLWYPRVYSFCATYIQDDSLAMDIAQDSFVEIWKRRRTISNPSALVSYLFTVVRNRCGKELLSRRAILRIDKLESDDTTGKELELMAGTMSTLDEMCREELHRSIGDIIKGLPDQSRKVIRMRLEMRMTSREIAELLGLSVRTVENEYFRAIRTVRNKMKERSLI